MTTRTTEMISPDRKLHGDPVAAGRMKKWVAAGVAVLLAFSLLNVYLNLRQQQLPDEIAGVVRYDDLDSQIVHGPIEYAQRPPAGGAHAELPQLCGFYRVPVPEEHVVASLATGAVWVTYDAGLSSSDIDAVWGAVQGEYDVIVTPYEGLESPVVLTSWGRQLALAKPDPNQIAMFAKVYQNRDWAPAVDETCSKGVGLPEP